MKLRNFIELCESSACWKCHLTGDTFAYILLLTLQSKEVVCFFFKLISLVFWKLQKSKNQKFFFNSCSDIYHDQLFSPLAVDLIFFSIISEDLCSITYTSSLLTKNSFQFFWSKNTFFLSLHLWRLFSGNRFSVLFICSTFEYLSVAS